MAGYAYGAITLRTLHELSFEHSVHLTTFVGTREIARNPAEVESENGGQCIGQLAS